MSAAASGWRVVATLSGLSNRLRRPARVVSSQPPRFAVEPAAVPSSRDWPAAHPAPSEQRAYERACNGQFRGRSRVAVRRRCDALLPMCALLSAHTLSSRPAWFITPADSAATRAVASRRVGYDRPRVRAQIPRRCSVQWQRAVAACSGSVQCMAAPRAAQVLRRCRVCVRDHVCVSCAATLRLRGDMRATAARVSQGAGCVGMVPLAGARSRGRRRKDA